MLANSLNRDVQEPPICKNLELKCKPNKNGHSSHWGLLPYDNNEWKHKLDETNTFIVNFSSKP